MGPLSGFRVIELCQIVSGPLACMMLADQGAEVIKVESTGTGDLIRLAGYGGLPFQMMFANCNRGKQSLAVDLGTDEGRAIVKELFKTADVVVQNYRPGAVERLGLGPDDALAINPRLVYVSITGYGATGPYADRKVYDPVMQGITGFVASQTNPQIPIPDVVRNIVVDKATSLTVAQAVTGALLARERGIASGQRIDVSMLEAGLAFFWPDGMTGYTYADDPNGPHLPTLGQVMSVTNTSDGHLIYFANTQDDLFGVFRSVGRADLCDDPRFSTMAARIGNLPALGDILAEAFLEFTTAEVLPKMLENQVAAGPVNSLADLLTDEQIAHNGTIWTWHHPGVGTVRQARPPIRYGVTECELNGSVPLLGEQTDAILASLGRSTDDIVALRTAGVVA